MRSIMLRAFSFTFAPLILCSCSLFGPRMQTIVVSSDPPGATVLVNGNLAGKTPLRYEVLRSENLHLEVRKPGYETQFRTASRNLSTLGMLDAIGAFLAIVPAFGLVSPAAWELYPSGFGIVLIPEEEHEKPYNSGS